LRFRNLLSQGGFR